LVKEKTSHAVKEKLAAELPAKWVAHPALKEGSRKNGKE